MGELVGAPCSGPREWEAAPLGGLEVRRALPALPAGPTADRPTAGSHSAGSKSGHPGPRQADHRRGGDVPETQVLRRAGPQLLVGMLRLLSGDAPCEAPAAPSLTPHLEAHRGRRPFSSAEATVCQGHASPRLCGVSAQPRPASGAQALRGMWPRPPACASVITGLCGRESRTL